MPAPLPVDLAASVQALGVPVTRAETLDELRSALDGMRGAARADLRYVETDRYQGVPDFDGWWDVPVAEVGGEGRCGRPARPTSAPAPASAPTWRRP